MPTFAKARKNITEEIEKMMSTWTKKEHEDFTRYLFKNRIKDRRENTSKINKSYKGVNKNIKLIWFV